MTAHIRFFAALAAGALVAPLALVAASTAPANAAVPKHKHELTLYRVEKTVKLAGVGTDTVGDSPSQTLSCGTGDYVLDGMWVVKKVDKYADPPVDPDDGGLPPAPVGGQYDDERDVWVKASYADPANFYRWKFEFANKAYGDAQVRMYITCIKGNSEYTNGHRHAVKVSSLFWAQANTTAHPGFPADRFYVDSAVAAPALAACTSDQFFVAPGFDVGSFDYRLVGTYPSQANVNGRSWTWEFAGAPVKPAQIWVGGRCIDRRLVSAQGHQHVLGMLHQPGLSAAGWKQSFVPQQDYATEVQYQCDENDKSLYNYKAMVGWFWMPDHSHNWFLGMEPRPKLRAFNFFNPGPGAAEVRYGTLCINARSSNPNP